ncbi:MAG: hypothetical protein AAGD09_25950 [Cyanobacteria bacterium P01_F01_bin.56]
MLKLRALCGELLGGVQVKVMIGDGDKAFQRYLWLGLSLGFAIVLTACLRPVATPEAVQQVEDTFDAHRSEFTQLVNDAIHELEQSNASSVELPDRSFYDFAGVSESLEREAIQVTFVIEEFYLPLVYVSTDNPQHVHDTCANGGSVIKQIEPRWYICQRDWN